MWPACDAGRTSGDQADGAEEAALRVVHLQGQQLAGEREDVVGQRSKAGIVDLSAGQGQTVGEGHGVLVRSVASADSQDLDRRTTWHFKYIKLIMVTGRSLHCCSLYFLLQANAA